METSLLASDGEKIRPCSDKIDKQKETCLWILNGGKISVGYIADVKDKDLLSCHHTCEILDSIESCVERDKFLLTKSIGKWSGYTCLWLACKAATNSPSCDGIRLVKLLIERISDTNKKIFIETLEGYLYVFSTDVCRLLLDNYDGSVIQLSTSPSYLSNPSDDVFDVILEAIEDKYDDVEQALVQYSTTRDYRQGGLLLLHSLTGMRRESHLQEILKRLTLQSRRYLLKYRDPHNDGVTPLYLSRHTNREIREKNLPGRDYFIPFNTSDSLIRMLNFFTNEYSVTSGVNLVSCTVRDASNTTLSTSHRQACKLHVLMKPKLSSDSDVMLFLSTKYVEVISVDMEHLNSLLQDTKLYEGYTCKIVLLQMIVRSPLRREVDLSQINTKITVSNLPTDVLYWFIFTCADLKPFIDRVVNNMNGLFSLDQLMILTRHALQKHQSVIYVSSIQRSSTARVVSSPAPVTVTVVSRDDTSFDGGDDSSVISHTYNAGSALVMLIDVCIERMTSDLIDLMNLPAMNITTLDDTLPKVVFIQFIIKDASSFKSDSPETEINLKPFSLPTDYSMCFMYTTQDMRLMIRRHLMNCNHMTIQQKLSELRQLLCKQTDVVYVSPIYSSLGRRLTWDLECEEPDDPELSPPPSEVLRLSQSVGSAFIICVTKDRSYGGNEGGRVSRIFKSDDSDWKGELNNAKYILERQLGLKVESAENLSGEEMLSRVKDFAEKTSGDDYSVVAIMSHGDENDHIIAADDTTVSVQDVVNDFSLYGDHPKIVILQYCRGPNRYSQLPQTHEEKFVKGAVRKRPKIPEFQPTSPSLRVVPPRNYFVVYSTSSDSRSSRGLLFKRMKVELYDMWKYKPPPKTVDMIEMMADVAGSVRDNSLLYQHIETVDTLCKPLHLSLYPHEQPDHDAIDLLS